jgi:uncharacterized protein (TIGR02001 family)
MSRGTRTQRFHGKGIARAASAAAILVFGGAAGTAHAVEWGIDGNVSVVSDYVLRGITTPGTESDGPAVQTGLDLTGANGFYGGWWASSLGYGTDNLATTVEHNFYAGFGGEANGFTWDVGLLYYWYMDDRDSSGFEPYASIGYGPVALTAHYMAEDVAWANQGDIYWTLGTEFEVGRGFSLGLVAGFSMYENRGDFIESTGKNSGFRHIDVTLSRQIGDTPATMFATYVIGGEDRDGLNQRDKVVLGFSYDFSAY